jgi:hypothetical protein
MSEEAQDLRTVYQVFDSQSLPLLTAFGQALYPNRIVAAVHPFAGHFQLGKFGMT